MRTVGADGKDEINASSGAAACIILSVPDGLAAQSYGFMYELPANVCYFHIRVRRQACDSDSTDVFGADRVGESISGRLVCHRFARSRLAAIANQPARGSHINHACATIYGDGINLIIRQNAVVAIEIIDARVAIFRKQENAAVRRYPFSIRAIYGDAVDVFALHESAQKIVGIDDGAAAQASAIKKAFATRENSNAVGRTYPNAAVEVSRYTIYIVGSQFAIIGANQKITVVVVVVDVALVKYQNVAALLYYPFITAAVNSDASQANRKRAIEIAPSAVGAANDYTFGGQRISYPTVIVIVESHTCDAAAAAVAHDALQAVAGVELGVSGDDAIAPQVYDAVHERTNKNLTAAGVGGYGDSVAEID